MDPLALNLNFGIYNTRLATALPMNFLKVVLKFLFCYCVLKLNTYLVIWFYGFLTKGIGILCCTQPTQSLHLLPDFRIYFDLPRLRM